MLDFFSCRSLVATGVLGAAAMLVLTGCGNGDNFSTAPVTGKVVLNGEPVTEGSITFSPISDGKSELSGKPASGTIQSDGTFTLTTYEEGDGAVVGKHRVMYSPPLIVPGDPAAGGHAAAAPKSKYEGATVVTPEVEVKAGEDNHFEIELKMP
jgi:hypothetical protein